MIHVDKNKDIWKGPLALRSIVKRKSNYLDWKNIYVYREIRIRWSGKYWLCRWTPNFFELYINHYHWDESWSEFLWHKIRVVENVDKRYIGKNRKPSNYSLPFISSDYSELVLRYKGIVHTKELSNRLSLKVFNLTYKVSFVRPLFVIVWRLGHLRSFWTQTILVCI